MQPKLLKIQKYENLSFTINEPNGSDFKTAWHYHNEIEITLIKKGNGTRFVGDNIQKFYNNDLVILGQNLPHVWRTKEKSYVNSSKNSSEAIVIHFSKEIISNKLFLNPEMQHINKLIEKSKRGIAFNKESHLLISNEINKMVSAEPFLQFMSLLKILNFMAVEKEHEYLSSEKFSVETNKVKNKKINSVINYIMENFHEEIHLSQVADIANLTRTSFCRKFKIHTGTNFTNFVNRIRVRYAASLLLEGDCNITEACFKSGFNNLSYFNRVFKGIIHSSPSTYKNRIAIIGIDK